MIAQDAMPCPLLMFCNVDPQFPGMVAMLAAGGGLDQIGRPVARVWGDVADLEVRDRLETAVRAAHAVSSLRGSTFGRIGGRSMGMYTAVAASDAWMRRFGVDVEEIDQREIIRRSEQQDPGRAKQGREWLERHTAAVEYDGDRLTPELQPELSTHFAILDVAEAMLNDPYDWTGPKETHVCATESDMDGALTMQILKLLSGGSPVLFADVRHFHSDLGTWDLANSGQHATWFAARSAEPEENLRHARLFPSDFYFPAGGASVQHLARVGTMTFARLSRLDGRYRMQVTRGELETYDAETNARLIAATSPTWPHAFARLGSPVDTFLGRYGSNHIHAIPGDFVSELRWFCKFADVDVDDLEAGDA